MSQGLSIGSTRHGNLQKHTNPNRLQAMLIERFHRKISKLIVQTRAKIMLDAGCGEGFLFTHLKQVGLDIDYVGSDLSLEAILWSRDNLHPDLKVTTADIHMIPHPSNIFPLVVCLEVLEHIPNSAIGLRELARVSQEYVLVSVPHEPFFRSANFLRGKHLSRWGNDPEHIHNYSGQAFRQLVSSELDLIWHGYSFPWQIALARKHA